MSYTKATKVANSRMRYLDLQLFNASSFGDLDAVKGFSKNGANPNLIKDELCDDEPFLTSVSVAVEKGRYDAISDGEPFLTSVSVAAEKGHHDVLKFLLEEGGGGPFSFGDYHLISLLKEKNTYTDEINQLIKDQNFRIDQNLCMKDIDFKLFNASSFGDLDAVKDFYKNGGNPNAVNYDDCEEFSSSYGGFTFTATLTAANNGHCDVVKFLIQEAGASPHYFTLFGDGPLFLSAIKGHSECVNLLLQKDVDAETYAYGYRTPIYEASRCGHYEVVKSLIEYGVDVNANSILTFAYGYHFGNTPLVAALYFGHLDVIELLIEHGAHNCHEKTVDNGPLCIAEAKNYKAVQSGRIAESERYESIAESLREKGHTLEWCNEKIYIGDDDFVYLRDLQGEDIHQDHVQA